MDRFEATIVRRQGDDGAEGVLIRTRPMRDNALENLLLNHFPSALEEGASEARITVLSDGTLMANGVTNSQRSAIKIILLQGRDEMFQRLEKLETEELLKKFASSAAQNILFSGTEFDFDNIGVKCPSCEALQIVMEKLRVLLSEEESPEQYSVPGADCKLPSDFQADFNAGVPARFKELVLETIRRTLPEAEKTARELPSNIERARRLIEE